MEKEVDVSEGLSWLSKINPNYLWIAICLGFVVLVVALLNKNDELVTMYNELAEYTKTCLCLGG